MNQRPETRHYEIVLSAIVLLPFIIVSAFNQPLGDDYWISALIRKHGFLETQRILYNTVSARYTALTLMSVNPLVFDSPMLFKLIPVIYLVIMFFSIRLFVNTLIPATSRNATMLSLIFVITYISVMPGIGEGLYWVSSLVVYHTGLLLFVLWSAFVLDMYIKGTNNLVKSITIVLLFIAILGCNELIGIITTLLSAVMFVLSLFHKKKVQITLLTCLLFSIPSWLYLVSSPSFHHRYFPVLYENDQFTKSIIDGGMLPIYHIGKVLVNPLFWTGVLLAIPYFSEKPVYRVNKWFVMISLAICALLISYASNLFSANHVVPLRISNMIVFIFILCLLLLALSFGSQVIQQKHIQAILKYRLFLLPVLLVIALLFKTNLTLVTRDLVSGDAYRYDIEMRKRWTTLKNCNTDTCELPVLQKRPSSLRYSAVDNDEHIGEYFNKVVVYSDSDK